MFKDKVVFREESGYVVYKERFKQVIVDIKEVKLDGNK